MYYQEKYLPRPDDYNRNGKLSYEAILHILEDAASRHSECVNDSIADANLKGIAWILAEWRVKILRRTGNGEKLSVTTWVRGKAPASAVYRDFIVNGEYGQETIRAEAKFALFDLKAERLTRIGEDLFSSYFPEEQNVFECSAPKLRTPSEYLTEKTLVLRRSDIDFNGHVHNTRYMDFVLEAIPMELYQRDNLSELRIIYMKPVKETDTVSVRYSAADNNCIIGVYGNDTPCSLVELKYRLP